MTRDSAAVATLDDRRRCPISAADDVSSLMTNSIATSCSSSNGDVGGGDEGCSPKSSSAVSTTTSCCGRSSSSSRSCSDDDDSAAVAGLSTANDDGCSTALKTSPLPLLHKEVIGDNNGDKDSSRSSNNDNLPTTTTSNSIGGRLTFYKDGKFIFQLAAHHQQHSYNNQTALTSPCRWIPVPTVIQQHKNNVKRIGERSQNHQNRTIWPYLVTNPSSDCKLPQSLQQSQLPIVRISERKSQQYQSRMKTPPLIPNDGALNTAAHTGAVVMATTTNIVRRPSRKCSITTAINNALDMQHRQVHFHLRPLSKRLQQHQHQSFMMVATKAVKAQRRLFLIPKIKRRRKTKIAINKDSPLQEQQQPLMNLECVVRNLWCRRHTTELLLRRQLSVNNNVEFAATTDTLPPSSRIVAVTTTIESSCTNMGNGKRRSVFSPLPTTTTPATTSIITNSIINSTGSNSPQKKYKLGQEQVLQQQHRVVDKYVKKTIPTSPSHSQIISTNDHSITAILSGGAVGARRPNGCSVTPVMDAEISVISSSTTNTLITSQKNLPTPISLLRTLLKSPSNESNALPVVASTNSNNYRHNSVSSRKRSAIESIVPIVATPVVTTVETGPRTTAMAIPPTAGIVNDTTLSALHQIPTLHHPVAAGQLAAAGYFNVLYHQAAMAAAMAYQTHAQLPQSLPKTQPPPLLSSQFPPTVDASCWKRQLNQQPLLPPHETFGGNGVSSASIVAPYSSPLATAAVNGNGLLLPDTPSPPPSLILHPHSVHHQMLLHQQQYQQLPTVQQSYHSHKQRHQGYSNSSGIKKRTIKYNSSPGGNNLDVETAVDEESSSSIDCMPLNLSKDSVAENVGGTSSTATVR